MVPLPGLIPDRETSDADVTIRSGDVPDALNAPLASGPNWQRGVDKFLLDIPSVGRFLLEGGRSIVFRPSDPDRDISIYLAGSVFGLLLHQRNQIVLHASAVVVNGKAVLFCGASGAGKSTMAASLVERGYRMVADDQCAISIDESGRPVTSPDGRMLKLWSASIDGLALHDRQGDAVSTRFNKYYVDPGESWPEPIPIGAVYALVEERLKGQVSIKSVNVVEAVTMMVANAYRPLMVRRMGQRQAYFDASVAVVSNGGVYRLVRPLSFKRIGESVDALVEHWASIGLTDPK